MNTRFEHKELAWLLVMLPLLVLLFGWLLRWKKRVLSRMGDARLVKPLTGGYSPRLFNLKFSIILLACILGIFAVMNPRTPGSETSITRKGIDVVFALDVSKSMLAADPEPSRLVRAKQFMNKLMSSMPDDRVALVLFAGKAYLQMPLTSDQGAASLYVAAAGPDVISQQGTVIRDALKMSANVFNKTEKRFKTVVLISDGEDHDDEAIRTAKELARHGVMINTIGIGSAEGAMIPDPVTREPKKDETGNIIISKLNEEELKDIAAATNGLYIRLQNNEVAVKDLNRQFSQIERKAYGDVSLMNFSSWYGWLVAGMILLLVAEFFIPEIKKQSA